MRAWVPLRGLGEVFWGVSRTQTSVAIAETDRRSVEVLTGALAEASLGVTLAPDAESLLDALADGRVDAALINLSLGVDGGGSLFEHVRARHPDATLIACVEPGETTRGVDAVQAGAADFLQKPYQSEEVVYVLQKALQLAARDAGAAGSTALSPQTVMVGSSAALAELQATIRRAADGIATVLVRGESGTGKELVARQLHELSPRRDGPFVRLNCAALPDSLLESELFGHEKGAFTGAASKKAGRVALAEGGTLFLDEIGDVTPAFQVKLLRLLQEREYEPLGATRTEKADVRFVAATHRPLEAMVRDETFRQDLFYRLNVVPIVVPPLRERPGDIDELAVHFARAAAEQNGRPAASPDASALALLRAQPWPGNVRQLQNLIERLVVLSEAPRFGAREVERELGRSDGIAGFVMAAGFDPPVRAESTAVELAAALKQAERRALDKALSKAGGNRSLAARILGVSRRTLYNKLEEHGLSEKPD